MSNVSQTSNAEKTDLIFTCKFVKKNTGKKKRDREMMYGLSVTMQKASK